MHRSRYRREVTRFATGVFILLAAGSARAESLTPDNFAALRSRQALRV